VRRLALAAALMVAAASVPAQDAPRIALGAGYSVAAPVGEGWTERGEGAQRSYSRVLGPETHTMVMMTAAGPSGITREQLAAIANADSKEGATLLLRAVSGFMAAAWKWHAAGLDRGRYTVLSKEDTSDAKFAGDVMCAATRIRARDRGPEGYSGEPLILRYVGYTCVSLKRLLDSAHVSYSERGLEADLSPAALEAGEAFARSLRGE